jgi:hypothetical protein
MVLPLWRVTLGWMDRGEPAGQHMQRHTPVYSSFCTILCSVTRLLGDHGMSL